MANSKSDIQGQDINYEWRSRLVWLFWRHIPMHCNVQVWRQSINKKQSLKKYWTRASTSTSTGASLAFFIYPGKGIHLSVKFIQKSYQNYPTCPLSNKYCFAQVRVKSINKIFNERIMTIEAKLKNLTLPVKVIQRSRSSHNHPTCWLGHKDCFV